MRNPFRGKITKIRRNSAIWNRLNKQLPTDGEVTLLVDAWDNIVIEFSDISALKTARALAKSKFQDWTDRLTSVWHTWGDNCLVEWNDKNHPAIRLWLRCKMSELPPSITKNDKCGFKAAQSTSYSFVCAEEEGL